METDIMLFIVSGILMVAGLAGCILPVIPGPPLSYLGLLALHFTDKVQFSAAELVISAIAVVTVTVLDYATPIIGSKRFGGSSYGTRGCVIGTVIGLFFMPWGLIICPFLGAVAGELIARNSFRKAMKAGVGSFLGYLFGTLLKLCTCIYFIIRFFTAVF